MQVETLGDGDPAYSVVACLHGDEPCGRRAIDRLVSDDPPVREPVKLVVANERAVDAGERFVDEDLNRAFPGDPEGDTHESRLAAELLAELGDTGVLDLHSTTSLSGEDPPYALVQADDEATARLAGATGLDRVVDIGYVSGGMIDHVQGVSVECGPKGSDRAAENAHRILWHFLAAVGVLDAPFEASDPVRYEVYGEVPKDGHEFVGRNFELVEAGETFARGPDGPLRAEEPFYPVLMSTDGYEDILGYRARKQG